MSISLHKVSKDLNVGIKTIKSVEELFETYLVVPEDEGSGIFYVYSVLLNSFQLCGYPINFS